MLIRCWGARGSVPVCGSDCLKMGGDTTCFELRSDDDELIVIDAGTGIRRLGHRLMKEGVKEINLLLTHMHLDHLFGFPFFKPLYDPSVRINIYGRSFTRHPLESVFKLFMEPPYFPVHWEQHQADITFHDVGQDVFTISGIQVQAIELNHPDGGLGYRFRSGQHSWALFTDNELSGEHAFGHTRQVYEQFIRGVDLLIHDGEYTPEEALERKGWGHSSARDATALALSANVSRLGLFHHNQDHSDEDVAEMVNACRMMLQAEGSAMECFAVHSGQEIRLKQTTEDS